MMIYLLQLALIGLLFLLSAFFAGTETGIYRLSRLRLRIGAEQNKSAYKLLQTALKDGQGLILSVLLGNNLVNYLLTSLVTVMLFSKLNDSHAAEIYATVILTPTLFLFGEIIPKVLYYHKANTLMPSLAWLVWATGRICTLSGAVWVLKGISKILSLLFRSLADTARAVDVTQRHQVHQIIHETQEEGLLSDAQKEMMARLMDISSISVDTVAVPLEAVQMISADSSSAMLTEHLRTHRRAYQLVYEGRRDNILGVISVYDILGRDEPLASLKSETLELFEIDRHTSVLEAINILRNRTARMALITETTKHRKRPLGIVTMTDLIGTLTADAETAVTG